MSFYTLQARDEELSSSQSSDEKMDTASESFPTQGTPNSVLSSDFDERDPTAELRLPNPDDLKVLRLAAPESNQNTKTSRLELENDLNDSLLTQMSNLNLHSPPDDLLRPKNLRISPPKLSSTLTTATSHPLMGLGSPDENYPDLIPKKLHKIEDEKDLSLSSIEDERPNETNGFYSPQCNTSKNNLYFTENFVTADSNILGESRLELSLTPDVAQVEQKVERRKIVPRFLESPKVEPTRTPQRVLGRIVGGNRDDSAIMKYVEERNKKAIMHSTPKPYLEKAEDSIAEEYHTGVTDWCESSSHMTSMPNFDLPIELSTNVKQPNDLESPDVISSSTQSDGSLFKAHLSIHTGRVSLKHNSTKEREVLRRKIVVPPEEEDRCSLDSVSGDSLGPEEDLPAPVAAPTLPPSCSDDDVTKTSKSSITLSEASDQIPEYSAADELRDERYYITVRKGGINTTCDMKVIAEYKRVVSHGGYDARGAALIVFSACHLPDNARPDYSYVMDNLFLYVIWTLERLITEEYVLVYLHGSAGRRRLPSFHWLHECYKLIDRRLRKSLKHLYLVHPTFWLKSFVVLTKPFVSSKFFRKLSYVKSLQELYSMVPVEPNAIPEIVKEYDYHKR